MDASTAQVYKLDDLVHLYSSQLKQHGVMSDVTVNSATLKQRLLVQFPDMRAHNQGRDMLKVFEEEVGAALSKAFL